MAHDAHPPWRAAQLNLGGLVRPEEAQDHDFEAVADALIELPRPDLDALGEALTEADADRLMGTAAQVFNKPLFDALPAQGDGERPGAMMDAMMELVFERIPGLREIRATRFAHLRRPILSCKVTFDEHGDFAIALELLSRHQTELLQAKLPSGDA